MIQRIQTLYFLIVFILTLLMFFFPLAGFIGDGEEFRLTVWGIKSLASGEKVISSIQMGVLAILACTLAFLLIFLYRKRWIQIRFCVVEIILQAGLLAFIVFYILRSGSAVATANTHSTSVYLIPFFPLINIILTYLAYRGVVKDETLVKSLDRIR